MENTVAQRPLRDVDYFSGEFDKHLVFTPLPDLFYNVVHDDATNRRYRFNTGGELFYTGGELLLKNTAYLEVNDAKSLDFYAELAIRNLPKYGERDGDGPAMVDNYDRVHIGLVGTAHTAGIL